MTRMMVAIFMAWLTVLTMVTVDTAKATSWSWEMGEAVLHKSEPAELSSDYCASFRQHIEVVGYGQRRACLFPGSAMRVGTTLGAGNEMIAVASLRYDTDFMVLDGVCQSQPDCVYIPATDTLVERRYIPGVSYLTIVVYDRASQRMQLSFDPARLTPTYRFDTNDPQYVLRSAEGQQVAAGSFAASDNGRWLAVELIGQGIARVDLGAGTARRVVAPGYPYGMGLDPRVELAITNDGQTVAVTGYNAGFGLYKITPECGDELRIPLPAYFQGPDEYCVGLQLDPTRHVNGFLSGHRPKFDQRGGQLTILVREAGGSAWRLTFWAPGYEVSPGLGYLALGDSFTSGEGETDDRYYLPGTNSHYEKCHLSERSYPFLIAGMVDALGIGMKSVACSGAKTEDIVSKEDYWGQGDRLGDSGLHLDPAGKQGAQDEAAAAFLPGRIPQAAFVIDHQPSVVTISVGGNDAGLMGKLKNCAMPGKCEWVSSDVGLFRTALEIRGLYDRLVTLYSQLKFDAPNTKFYSVGYPLVIVPGGTCDPVTEVLLDYDERLFMDQGLRYLNEVIQEASHAAGVAYLDIQSSLHGHQLCSGADELAMNGLRLGDDIAPIEQLPMLQLIGTETFHPSPYGHQLIAAALSGQFSADIANVECYCAPAESSYWMPHMIWEPVRSEAMTLTRGVVKPDGRHVEIRIPTGSFLPDTSVEIKLGLDGLKTATVNDDGGLTTTIELPDGLSEGFYALHAYGVSYGGQTVDVYQIITFGEPVEPVRSAEAEGSVSEVDAAGGSSETDQAATPATSVPAGLASQQLAELLAAPIASSVSVVDAGVLGARTDQPQQLATFNWVHATGIGLIIVGVAGVTWVVILRRRK